MAKVIDPDTWQQMTKLSNRILIWLKRFRD